MNGFRYEKTERARGEDKRSSRAHGREDRAMSRSIKYIQRRMIVTFKTSWKT